MSEEIVWEERFAGKDHFSADVNNDIQYPINSPSLTTEKYGLGCVRCNTVQALHSCSNCGGTGYRYGVNRDDYVGIFCMSCNRGFTSWKCDKCGCDNPVNEKTIYMRKGGGGCFIATAAYGSASASQVCFLRSFRESYLRPTLGGRCFIKLYELLSPPLANLIERHELLRAATRRYILSPLVWIIRAITR